MIVLVMMYGIDWHADIYAWREVLAADIDSAGKNLAGEDATDAWGHSKALVDAGAEISAGLERGATADRFEGVWGREGGEYLGCELVEDGRVMEEIEEGGRDRCGCCIGACYKYYASSVICSGRKVF